MITAKRKRSPVKLLVTFVVLGLIVGGTASIIILQETGNASVTPDFTMTLYTGLASDDNHTWSNFTSTDTILNGTSGLGNSGLKIIVVVGSQGTFNGFIRLNVSGLPAGITFSFRPLVLRTVAGGNAASALTLRAAANVTSQAAPYNVTVTATSSSPALTHAGSFPLRVRSTKLFWSPSVLSVSKGQKFTLRLELSDVYNVTGFQASASFNSTLITALTNGTIFSPDFPRYGYVVHNPAGCSWADNATGTIGPPSCPVGALVIGQCVNAPCITENSTQTYNLLNQTFVANTSYNGTIPITLSNSIITEALSEGTGSIFQDPHHPVGAVITIAETGSAAPPVLRSVPIASFYRPLGLLLLLPLVFHSLVRRPARRINQ